MSDDDPERLPPELSTEVAVRPSLADPKLSPELPAAEAAVPPSLADPKMSPELPPASPSECASEAPMSDDDPERLPPELSTEVAVRPSLADPKMSPELPPASPSEFASEAPMSDDDPERLPPELSTDSSSESSAAARPPLAEPFGEMNLITIRELSPELQERIRRQQATQRAWDDDPANKDEGDFWWDVESRLRIENERRRVEGCPGRRHAGCCGS